MREIGRRDDHAVEARRLEQILMPRDESRLLAGQLLGQRAAIFSRATDHTSQSATISSCPGAAASAWFSR